MASNVPKFYELLRTDRDDTMRSRALEDWVELQSPEVQATYEHHLAVLRSKGLGDHQAKALLAFLICFCHMKVDEMDKWRAHGEAIRADFEWDCAQRGVRKEALE